MPSHAIEIFRLSRSPNHAHSFSAHGANKNQFKTFVKDHTLPCFATALPPCSDRDEVLADLVNAEKDMP